MGVCVDPGSCFQLRSAGSGSASSLLAVKPSFLLYAAQRSVCPHVKYETAVSYQYLCVFSGRVYISKTLAKLMQAARLFFFGGFVGVFITL